MTPWLVLLASLSFAEGLPSYVDWSAAFPEPRSQGEEPTCVGHAVANLKAFQEGREEGWDVDSHRFDFRFVWDRVPKGSSGGASIPSALSVVRDEGMMPLWNGSEGARAYRVASWHEVAIERDSLRRQLAAGSPVIVGIDIEREFKSWSGTTSYVRTGRLTGTTHAIMVVGYDDRRRAFRLLNSWGDDWGDDGYAWVAYDSMIALMNEAYVVDDASNGGGPVVRLPEPPPPAPKAGARIPETWLTHNEPMGYANGMTVHLRARIEGARGHDVRACAFPKTADGEHYLVSPPDGVHECVDHLVCSCVEMTPTFDAAWFDHIELQLPYGQLHTPRNAATQLRYHLQIVDHTTGETLVVAETAAFEVRR